MSELYKAMKRIEDYQSTKPLYKQIAEIKGIASTARYGYDIQPQLTIPESIADDLDKIPNEAKRYVQENGFDDYSILDDFVELREFYEADEDDIFPKFMELKDFVKDNLNL
ncbi:MAG: hypothetical protein L0K31_12275, partial [Lactococcus lactis]|nr:hypothetical protein [Lactococcus lactis]